MAKPRFLLLFFPFFLAALPTAAQPFGRPLTPEEVACEERQLNRLVHRFSSGVGIITVGNAFLWRADPDRTSYQGLAAFGRLEKNLGERVHEESQIAFDLFLRDDQDFLSPQRALLPQATLVRRDAASNLRPATVPLPYLNVVFELAPEVADPTTPLQPIQITNRQAAREGQSDRAGRGLAIDDLLSVCHHELTPFDLRVFSILARTVRASECLLEPFGCQAFIAGHKSVIFRSEEPLSYRINLFSYFSSCDDEGHCSYGEADTALLFHLQVNAAGQLTIGDVQALPWCTGGPVEDQIRCTQFLSPLLGIYVLPPIRPGGERQGEPEFQRGAFLNVVSLSSEFNILQDNVNWADLLRDTAWNQGFEWAAAPANACTAEP